MSQLKMKGGSVTGVEIDPHDTEALEYAEDTIAAAAKVLRAAMAGLATFNIVIAHEIASLGIPVYTDEIPTMAVTIGGDGIVRWLVNPQFVVETGETDIMFVMVHEVDHVVLAHLVEDSDLGRDEIGTLAAEVVINHRVAKLLKRDGVPSKDGKPLGVCPKKVHKDYSKALRDNGDSPVSYEDFVSTDIACASHLRNMPKPPSKQRQNICVRSDGSGGVPQQGAGNSSDDGQDEQGGHGHGSGIDPETAGKIVDDVLNQVMTRALRGDESAKQDLLDLGGRLGEDHPLWGNLGLGALRGETPPPVEVSFWEQYLLGALTSVLVPGSKLVYPKKLIGFEDLFEEAGYRMPFQPIGEDRHTRLGISIDTSGSMSAEVLRKLAALVGRVPNCEVEWSCFDAEVYPFEPGHNLRGGGGTSFDVVKTWAESRDDDPFDCVLVVTDGYAPPIMPNEPDKWVWLITPGGNMWPADKGMSTVIVDLPGS